MKKQASMIPLSAQSDTFVIFASNGQQAEAHMCLNYIIMMEAITTKKLWLKQSRTQTRLENNAQTVITGHLPGQRCDSEMSFLIVLWQQRDKHYKAGWTCRQFPVQFFVCACRVGVRKILNQCLQVLLKNLLSVLDDNVI